MGGGASKPLRMRRAESVRHYVEDLGSAYSDFAKKLHENGYDGDVLASMSEDELAELFDELEVPKPQRIVLRKKLSGLKGARGVQPPESGGEQVDEVLARRRREAVYEGLGGALHLERPGTNDGRNAWSLGQLVRWLLGRCKDQSAVVLDTTVPVYPCETKGCATVHGNASGVCPECTRRALLPPGLVKSLRRLQRRSQLLLMTLVMSFLETEDKALLLVFCGSLALVLVCYVLVWCVARPDEGARWVLLVALVAAGVAAGASLPGLVKAVEAVDDVKVKFNAASERLLKDKAPGDLGLASRQPNTPARQKTNDFFVLFKAAQELRPHFENEVLRYLATFESAAPRNTLKGASIKRLARSRQKTAMDYGGDAAMLKDLLRGSVICSDVDDFAKCFRGLAQLERDGVVSIVIVKNRVRDGALASGYIDANCIVKFRDYLVEVQLHLADIVAVKKEAHGAYEASRELDLMGALAEPPEEMPRSHLALNAARLVVLGMCLVPALLYVDAFVLKGGGVVVERAKLLPTRGFAPPFVFLRLYGLVLAAPYFALAYVLIRAMGLLGEAARQGRRRKSRIALLYDQCFGYEGTHFAWKVAVVQCVEVTLQVYGKAALLHAFSPGAKHAGLGGIYSIWVMFVIFMIAIAVNIIYPPLLLRRRSIRFQRDAVFVVDGVLDIIYAVIPYVCLFSGVRNQTLIIPYGPWSYSGNLIPLLHVHFLIVTLEAHAGGVGALRRTAPAAPAQIACPQCKALNEAGAARCAECDSPFNFDVMIEADLEQAARGAARNRALPSAHNGRLPVWACVLYLAVTITLASLMNPWDDARMGSEASACPPCDCQTWSNPRVLEGCSGLTDAYSLVWHLRAWNRNKMTKLDMTGEHIDKIKPGAFSPGLEDKVEMLFMDYNSISRLAAGTFDGLDGVRKISMWENNIRAIEAGAFRGCPSLEKLDLSSNELTTFEAVEGLAKLMYLDLTYNYLESLSDSLGELRALVALDLDYNPDLASLPLALLELPHLEFVGVAGTAICRLSAPALDPAFDTLVATGVVTCSVPYDPTQCSNDLTTSDEDGDDCSMYDTHADWCGDYDDDDFTARKQCCVCGGGDGVYVPV